jgi:hypothetical protein
MPIPDQDLKILNVPIEQRTTMPVSLRQLSVTRTGGILSLSVHLQN